MKNKTVLVAMSGGVDSSVAAMLLKNEGYNLIGVTMKTWNYDNLPEKDSGCCNLETIYNARGVSAQLGFNHYTLDFTDIFNEIVIKNFIKEYMNGKTPNPCVLCNKEIKWGALLKKAKEFGADYIATGHYARVRSAKCGVRSKEFNYGESGRYYISAAEDKDKDQSYALWQVSQYALSKTLFPLGNLKKTEVRRIAGEMNLKPASIPDSQEICFVPNNDYRELLKIRVPDINYGDIIYKDRKIGTHEGYPFYTIGQRRGLNISAGKPVYVSKIDTENNIVYVDDEESLYSKSLNTREINLMMFERLERPVKAKVKIRYKDEGGAAVIEQIDNEHIKVTFDSPRKAITPGQSAVFYEGDDVIGGGVIDTVIN